MRMELVTALVGLITVSACTGSPATLALAPDFELETPVGIAGVSIRESPSGMTDAEFEQLVAHGMVSAMSGSLVNVPVRAPFPTRRIVWHVTPVAPRGVERLVVNVFDGSDAFAYEEQVVDNSAPRIVIESAIASITSRLAEAISQHDLRASAYRR
jgi:hypothetical protein